ncbi:MAG TPA: hypothetical protein PK796_03810 [Bacteroidales bacterium]|jgi:hypothetical protein|nr:hypothetical protein [Bacteroidales bacterium]
MKKHLLLLPAILLLPCLAGAQFAKELMERPGTFEILGRTEFVSSQGKFAKAELTAHAERLNDLVTVLRQNEVLSDIKGFACRTWFHRAESAKCEYGVPSSVTVEFCSYFYNKEKKVVYNTIEPPNWGLLVNKADGLPLASSGFDSGKGYFTAPLNKKTIAPGVDVYDGEFFVIYDPSRPDYWSPVTVNEAFECARAFSAKETDEFTRNLNQQFLDNEWNEIPAEYRDKPAYFGGGLARVTYQHGYQGQDSLFPRIVQVNPAYWNKSLPKSAIQIITLHAVQNKVYLKNRLDGCMQYTDRGSGCDLPRFEYSYGIEDIKRLTSLIGK